MPDHFTNIVKPIYVYGIDFIYAVQRNLKLHENSMSYIYRLSDPWMIYFVLFPFLYCFSTKMGLKILWSTAICEFVGIILKMLLHGERPYWWIYESPYYVTAPRLAQFPLTCQTTPATPSVRSMVVACVSYILTRDFCRYVGWTTNKKYYAMWSIYYMIQTIFLSSTAFFATNFPHQVILSTLLGCTLAKKLTQIDVKGVTFSGFMWLTFAMLSAFSAVFFSLFFLGFDVTWASGKASAACMQAKWFDMRRDELTDRAIRCSALILGLGLATRLFPNISIKDTGRLMTKAKLAHAAVGTTIIIIYDAFIQPNTDLPSLYYVFVFVKYTIPPVLIVTDIRFITALSRMISNWLDENRENSEETMDRPNVANEPRCCNAEMPHHTPKTRRYYFRR